MIATLVCLAIIFIPIGLFSLSASKNVIVHHLQDCLILSNCHEYMHTYLIQTLICMYVGSWGGGPLWRRVHPITKPEGWLHQRSCNKQNLHQEHHCNLLSFSFFNIYYFIISSYMTYFSPYRFQRRWENQSMCITSLTTSIRTIGGQWNHRVWIRSIWNSWKRRKTNLLLAADT